MQLDINALLPQFISENGFNVMYSDSLANGKRFYLMGISYNFGCLLIADAMLAETFSHCMKLSIGADYITELDHKLDIFEGKTLEFIQNHWLPPGRTSQDHKQIEVIKICQLLDKKRGGKDSSETNLSLKLIYRLFNEVVRRYEVHDNAMNKLDDLFEEKFKELVSVPSNSIKVLSLTAEVEDMLKKLGCQRRVAVKITGDLSDDSQGSDRTK